MWVHVCMLVCCCCCHTHNTPATCLVTQQSGEYVYALSSWVHIHIHTHTCIHTCMYEALYPNHPCEVDFRASSPPEVSENFVFSATERRNSGCLSKPLAARAESAAFQCFNSCDWSSGLGRVCLALNLKTQLQASLFRVYFFFFFFLGGGGLWG